MVVIPKIDFHYNKLVQRKSCSINFIVMRLGWRGPSLAKTVRKHVPHWFRALTEQWTIITFSLIDSIRAMISFVLILGAHSAGIDIGVERMFSKSREIILTWFGCFECDKFSSWNDEMFAHDFVIPKHHSRFVQSASCQCSMWRESVMRLKNIRCTSDEKKECRESSSAVCEARAIWIAKNNIQLLHMKNENVGESHTPHAYSVCSVFGRATAIFTKMV